MTNKTPADGEQQGHIDRDWPEDFAQENGNYSNKCVHCGLFFNGNKHRMECKQCDAKIRSRTPAPAESELREALHFYETKIAPTYRDNGYLVTIVSAARSHLECQAAGEVPDHIGWAREWEGDDSDLGQYIVEMCLPGEPKPDDNPNWFPLYTSPHPEASTQGAAVDVEALKKSIISWAFAECQPDRGDVFSWLDDNKDSLAEYLAAQGHLPAPSSLPDDPEEHRAYEDRE